MCEEIYTLPPNAIPAVFCNTGIELGATVEFVQWVKDNYYSNVQIIRPDPKRAFDWIVKNKGMALGGNVYISSHIFIRASITVLSFPPLNDT